MGRDRGRETRGGASPAPPSSEHATLTMRANRRVNTGPELALRSELHRRGLRYRVDIPTVVAAPGRPPRPDIAFPRQRVAVFVDGCFWHSCPEHGSLSVSNRPFWRDKLKGNVLRDRRTDCALETAGWCVVRIWEHDSPVGAADQIERVVRERRRLEIGVRAEAVTLAR